jgi:DNA-binding NtrC family response regulator
MDSNAFPSEPSAKHNPESSNPEAAVRAWIRLLALREETYHAARQHVLDLFEDEYFHWLMQRTAGNRSKAARIAGVTRRTVYRLAAHHVDAGSNGSGAETHHASPGDFDGRPRENRPVAIREPVR